MALPRPGASYRVAAAIIRPVLQATTKQAWSGTEHIPRSGGVIVAANHLSHADPLVFAHFVHDQGRSVRFLAKHELFEVPVFGRFISGAGQIPVRRRTRTAGVALDAAEAAIGRGECLVIYPEGTITRDPALWPMAGKTGVARVALATGCDVVPAAQWGAQEILAPYAKKLRLFPRKTIRVAAGPPVDLSEFHGHELTSRLLKQATARIMADITGLLEKLRQEQAPPEPFDPEAPPAG